jgi:hypothetical protein
MEITKMRAMNQLCFQKGGVMIKDMLATFDDDLPA